MSFANLLPKPDELAAFDDFDKVLSFGKLELNDWKLVAAKLGDEHLKDLIVIAGLSPPMVTKAMDEADLSAILRVKVSLVYNATRAKFGMEVVDINFVNVRPEVPPGSSLPAGAAPGNVAKLDKLRVRDHFDQGSRLEVVPIGFDKILALRRVWVTAKGNDPPSRKTLTDNQFSVLSGLVEMGHNPVGFDTGVWRPGGRKRERKQLLSAHTTNSLGEMVTKEIPSVGSLEKWVEIWDFATTGVVCCAAIDEAVMDAYKECFVSKAERFPDAWAICAEADLDCRLEWMGTERQRQTRFHTDQPTLSSFDPMRPWNTVLWAASHGAEGFEFWQTNLVEKARDFMEKKQADMIQEVTGTRFVRDDEDQDPSDKAEHRRSDGRYMYDVEGVELCYSWGRNEDGCCDNGCLNNPKRSHLCEWCRIDHKSIRCPMRPGWNPNGGDIKHGRKR